MGSGFRGVGQGLGEVGHGRWRWARVVVGGMRFKVKFCGFGRFAVKCLTHVGDVILGGSWVVISGLISKVTIPMTLIFGDF